MMHKNIPTIYINEISQTRNIIYNLVFFFGLATNSAHRVKRLQFK